MSFPDDGGLCIYRDEWNYNWYNMGGSAFSNASPMAKRTSKQWTTLPLGSWVLLLSSSEEEMRLLQSLDCSCTYLTTLR